MRNKLSLLVVTCAVLLASVTAMAGSGKQIGTSAAPQLLIPVGARSTALSGSNIASVSGIDAIYWNPAGASVIDSQAEAVLSYQNYLADINITYAGAVAHLGDVGNFGLTFKTLNFGNIEQTTIDNPDGNGTIFSPNFITLGMHYSRKFTDRIQFGTNVKIIQEKIMSAAASGVALDFGLQYVNDATGLKLGVALTNFSIQKMQYTGADLEYRIQLPGTEAGTTPGSVSMVSSEAGFPTQLKLGVGYDLDLGELNQLSFNGSFSNNSSFYDNVALGVEYGFNDMFFLRGSYSLAIKEGLEDEDEGFVSMNEDYLYGPAFGAGAVLGAGTFNLKFDYAYQVTEFFDDVQWFGFTFGF